MKFNYKEEDYAKKFVKRYKMSQLARVGDLTASLK